MQTKKIPRIFQYTTRIAILVFITYEAIMHQIKGVLAAPNAHVFCPFGGLETLYQLAVTGGYVKKIMPATLVLLVGSILLAIVLNRAFCGWICPLGTLQMLFDRIARFFKIKKVKVPVTLEKYLGFVKYIILVAALYFTWRAGDLVYGAYDPWAAYAHLSAGFEELYSEFLIGSIFLILALVGSLWLPNNFCRYFCPMGAFLSIFSKFSPSKIARNEQSCINCKKCDRVCPAQIKISTEPEVKSGQCLSCGDCIDVCPVNNTLDYKFRGKTTLRWLVYGIATLIVFFAPVVIAKQAGWWKVNFSDAQEVLIDASGVLNPYNIKGSMTLESVLKEFNVPREEFLKGFNLPDDTNDGEMLKNIAASNDLEVEAFRELIAQYLQKQNPDLIFEGAETHEPAEGAPPAEEPTTIPAVQETPAETPKMEQNGEQHPQTESTSESPPPVDIRGKTTMGELLEYGLSKEQFKELSGIDMPDDAALKLKDFADQHGLDRESLREKFTEALQ